ncbi:hypothetical protein BO70DRAFT_401729 [Aspergillus heteromorphus CBS 117.55]|uniref:Zn(2)-C6 fungal-type domain-containing protein n=1 Tax=Aspergillus heteromorphus CBS 117.55 TaxID=1448321 RepID=A0A317X1F8_9EURO|nr:uncharacterized protein BO70DRAFT_401729 [Aspergillus heteromorphus CBS 117.55]PWY92021.1 hypothetical protein BO70DRAFT_401729 [Aspergillus heteromorphus CBS 117.55]
MKRKNDAVPGDMVQRWARPPLSCRLCRAKKLRCDRAQPCSNCVLRKVSCQYGGQGLSDESEEMRGEIQRRDQPAAGTSSASQSGPRPATAVSPADPTDVLNRIRRLEEAVFDKAQAVRDISLSSSQKNIDSLDDWIRDMKRMSGCLPPWPQARQLFNQFAMVIQPNFGVLHIPTVKALVDKSYQTMLEGGDPSSDVVMLLLSIFAGAALVATPELLQTLNATQVEVNSAFRTYTRLAMAILDNNLHPVSPSTVALEAISTLAHVLSHADGYSDRVQSLRVRAMLMARTMQIHRLDTAKSQDERNRSGYNNIEIEVQRRIWWHLVSSDWIISFSQGPQEGTYFMHPAHMKVNRPANINDEQLTANGPEQSLPLTTHTSMSVFLLRIQHAELCREVVDTLSSTYTTSEPPDYSLILALDQKFRNFINCVPPFFQMPLIPTTTTTSSANPQSNPQSHPHESPSIARHRTIGHLGFHIRLCRLHRPFHRLGSANSQYAYSRTVCIRSAQTVLDLHRTLDQLDDANKRSKYWPIMHHVFFAAMVLATDVSMNPTDPGAEARKQEVLHVVALLERERFLSSTLGEAIQKNEQTLLAILRGEREVGGQNQQQGVGGNEMGENEAEDGQVSSTGEAAAAAPTPGDGTGWGVLNEGGEESWGQLWSDLFNVAPEGIDGLQWDSLLNDWDLSLEAGF